MLIRKIILNVQKNKNKFIKNKKGATAIEYALIAALIALAIIGAMTTLGDTMRTRFEELSETIMDLLRIRRWG